MSRWQIILGSIERYLSPFIALFTFILVFSFKNSFQFLYKETFLDKLISIGSALFAFLLTILTIIVQSESESVKKIKNHPGYKRFITFNRRIVLIFLFTTLLSVTFGYYGLICATYFGLFVPVISVQMMPL